MAGFVYLEAKQPIPETRRPSLPKIYIKDTTAPKALSTFF